MAGIRYQIGIKKWFKLVSKTVISKQILFAINN